MSDLIQVVYAKNTATVAYNGAQARIHKGQHWAADDPLVQQHPEMFSPDPRWGMQYTVQPQGFDGPPHQVDAPVETATAAPGEKRNTRRA